MDCIIGNKNKRIAYCVGEKMPNPFSAKGSVANVNAYAGRFWEVLAVAITDLVRVSTLSEKAEFH
eukprot:4472840-Ditylum_brightwellii.AAC.1